MFAEMVKKISYNPSIRALVQISGLQSVARRLYHHSFGSRQGIIELHFGRSFATFSIPTIRELRALDYFASGGEPEFERLLDAIKPGDCFWDIGAQYGCYAYLVSNQYDPGLQVVAFEPFPRDYALLYHNAKLNPGSRVRAVNAALSDQDGEVIMTAGEREESCPKVIAASEINSASAASIFVPCWRGDTLVQADQYPFPNVLKIDVEGHEMRVLRGLDQTLADPRCRSIYCEIHDALMPKDDTAWQLTAFLARKGFVIEEMSGPNHYVFGHKPALTF